MTFLSPHPVGPTQHAPPASVCAAFGRAPSPRPLPEWGGGAWLVDDLVLRRADWSEQALAWQEDVLCGLEGAERFRVARPVRAPAGQLTVRGWRAWRCEPGMTEPGRWLDIVAAGRDFHAALASVPPPSLLGEADRPWADADHMAWGEHPTALVDDLPVLDEVVAALQPVVASRQIVHADLTRNVLFAPGLPPLVIGLTPTWRPPAYAHAVVVVDAVALDGAPERVVADLAGAEPPELGQCLLRAVVYRAATDVLHDPGSAHQVVARYHGVARLALSLVAS